MGLGQFTVKINPDIILGDVSNIVGNTVGADSGDVAFTTDDILFDWQALQVPKGANKLISISGYLMGQDGGEQVNADLEFVFAKSINGTAPGTLGAVNAAQTACFELPLHYIGVAKVEATSSVTLGPKFGDYFSSGFTGSSNGHALPIILEGEPSSGQNVGYDVIYVAAFTLGATDFSTGVKPSAQAATSTDTIAVDGVDPRKCFQVGDTVYTNTDDTALGTVKSMGANSIVLNASLAVQVEDNEEIVNANPVTVIFGFEK